ncbi:MAG: hypothetical protein ACFCUR_20935 [Rhodomicrobiaceae bacterium]
MATGFLIPPGTSAEELAQRRQMAQALMQQGGSGAPIGHWSQGANRLAQALMGGWDMHQMQQEGKAERKEAQQLLNETLGLPSAVQSQRSQPGQTAQNLVGQIVNVESGGNPTATNPRSSATGSGQFIDSTWLEMMKRHKPQAIAGKADADILAMRNDPGISREMVGAYANENAARLKHAGFEPTPGNIYLAHFAGPAGAIQTLSANPATPVSQVLGQQAVAANPFLAEMTAGDLRNWADRKMGGASGGAPAQEQPAQTAQANSLGIDPKRAQLIGRLSANPHTAPLANKLLEQALTPQKPQIGRFRYQKGAGIIDSATGQIVRPDESGPEQPKPPTGYRWGQDGQSLEPIPGGPATTIPGEQAGRLAAIQTAKTQFGEVRKFFQGMDVFDRANKMINRGKAGRAERTVELAIEAALRAMTGAAAPAHEVEMYMGMFAPSAWDTQTTMADKLDRLEAFIANAERNLTQGRGGVPQSTTPTTTPKGNRLRYNPQTGQLE